MELEYTLTGQGARVDRVLDPGAVVIIPEQIEATG